jgi:hypothetical protein
MPLSKSPRTTARYEIGLSEQTRTTAGIAQEKEVAKEIAKETAKDIAKDALNQLLGGKTKSDSTSVGDSTRKTNSVIQNVGETAKDKVKDAANKLFNRFGFGKKKQEVVGENTNNGTKTEPQPDTVRKEEVKADSVKE